MPPVAPLWFDREDVRLVGELVGALGDNVDGMLGPSPLEARFGVMTRPSDSLAVGLRAGAGLVDQIGSPRWRVMFEVAWQGDRQLLPATPSAATDVDEAADDER